MSQPTARSAGASDEVAADARLLERLRAGEDAAFEELVRRFGGRLLAVARRIVRDEEDARDCVQEAFLAAHRSLPRFEGRARIGTWLHRIVTNAALMKLRTRRRKPESPIDDLQSQFDRLGFLEGPTQTTPLGADELLAEAGVAKQVRDAIDQLPDSYRTILLLRDIEDYDTAETAELLEITPGAVKVRLHRARTALKNLLSDVFQEPS